jgi:uncharacterized membrane protein YfcA
MLTQIALLYLAGFLGGALNSIAGGGSFITFPALLFAGVPAISANATNTFASLPGYMVGAYVMRHDMMNVRKDLPRILAIAFVGGCLGAWLLLHTPETKFIEVVPWLLLFATILFIFGGKINQLITGHTAHHRHASKAGAITLAILLLTICTYGGFFNAGLGIITLSYLVLAGMTDIRTMTGLKLLISSCVSVIAVALFIVDGAIDWGPGLAVLMGTLTGGAITAHLSRALPQEFVRRVVITASISITLWFFYDVYFKG